MDLKQTVDQGLLTNITSLWLMWSSLTGILKEFSLRCRDVSFVNKLPSELGLLTCMEFLYLNENSLTGSIRNIIK